MVKIGRNDPCPCGSGKKYKKCCLGTIVTTESPIQSQSIRERISQRLAENLNKESERWTLSKVQALSTERIVLKLQALGIDYNQDRFIEELKQFGSVSAAADHWMETCLIRAKGFDVDFIWMGARTLWERLAPGLIVTERLDDQMQEGYTLLEDRKFEEVCTIWLEVWEHLKTRFTSEMESIEDAEIVFEGTQSLQNWCQDLEGELGNAGRKDPAFCRKRIDYCREFCQLFPASQMLIIQNMRRAEAEAHFDLGEVEQGEALYEALIRDYPDFTWGYIGWGDMYWLFRNNEQVPLDYFKAERIYKMALEKGVEEDRDAVEERLKDLRNSRARLKGGEDVKIEEPQTITDYDPLNAPDPSTWLALDEGERILMVEDYHEREEIDLPNLKLHASFHVIIENQIAEDNPKEVRLTLERLFEKGLDRHDAIHALAWALSEPMYGAMKNPSKQQNVTEQYRHNLKSLTAKKWLRSMKEETS